MVQKTNWSGRYINFFPNHCLTYKIGIIYSLTDRAILLSDKEFHINNLDCVRSTLLKNGYPLDLLNEKIFERYKKIFERYKKSITNLNKTSQVCEIYNIDYRENRKVITFPYIQNFQEQLCRIFKKTKLQIIFTIENSFQTKLFATLKDRTQKKFKYNVICEINCIQCNKKYIGQTCRFLHNRLLEHARSVKNKDDKTALAEHATSYKHSFDFKNTKSLDTENIFKKRLILAMIYIQKENFSVNYETDIENLSAIYNNIIKSIK